MDTGTITKVKELLRMGNKFEKDSIDSMQSNTEISEVASKALENTDSISGMRDNRRLSLIRRVMVAAVCLIVIAGAFLSNEAVRAVIKPVFGFGEKGIERTSDEGKVQQNKSSSINQNIRVTLDNYNYNSYKLGLNFKVKFDDNKILKDYQSVSLEYRIKNGNGEYIIEIVNDNKPLKGKTNIISTVSENNSAMDLKSGEIRYNFSIESFNGRIPELENATIEIESVRVIDKKGNIKVINGSWNLPIK